MQNVRDIVIRLFFISLANRRAPDPLSKLPRCSDKISRSITYRALFTTFANKDCVKTIQRLEQDEKTAVW